jgi:cytosine/adenosine deaminase-related metal-dependent hydrolase
MARGMPGPAVPPRNFIEVLERVWWRLDRALDDESVYLSGLLGAMEAARSGTTLLVDHHSSPSFIHGSLGLLRRAIEDVGLRSVLCYEVTDRNGSAGRDEGLAENAAFVAEATGDLTRAMVGAHASFTLSDESLAHIGGLAHASGSGVHIHVAEDRADVEDCLARHGETLPQRLARHGLRGPRSLWAHCVHLAPGDAAEAAAAGGWIAHNPRSNMNNAVGYAAPARRANPVALGTDGIGADMLEEFRLAYVRHREDDVLATPDVAWSWLEHGYDLVPEARADRVTWSYEPIEPWHVAFTPGIRALDVDIDGRPVLRAGRPTRVDPVEVRARAAEQAARLFRLL